VVPVLTLAEKLELLFEYGESRGISAAYRAIAVATGENANNIRKIHRGENKNPGLKILTALGDYFGVDLAYFNCKTKVDCEAYLSRFAPARETDEIKLRAHGMSEAGLAALRTMMDMARRAEGLPPVKKPGK
jgi:transcriptional regulator with XRE-family HTH domain